MAAFPANDGGISETGNCTGAEGW